VATKRSVLLHATRNQFVHLRVFGFHRGHAAVQQWYFPKAARTGALHANDELGRLALLVPRAGNDGGHDRADKSQAHDHDDFAAQLAILSGQSCQAREFLPVISRSGQGKFFTGWTEGDFSLWFHRILAAAANLFPKQFGNSKT